MEQRLYKSNTNVVLDGVCAGIAEYFAIDASAVRLAWIVFCLMGGSGLLIYLILIFVMPRRI